MAAVVVPLRRVEATEPVEPDALVRAIAGGDRDALGVLFDRHRRDVFAFLHRLTRASEPELDDLVQTTFLAVPAAARRYRGKSSVRTWLLGIAANVGRTHCRSEARRRRALAHLAVEPAREPARPDEEVTRKEALRRLAVAIEKLPYRIRVAYVLCVVDGTPGREVASVLGIREGTLWRRVHDARRRLRKALGRNPGGKP